MSIRDEKTHVDVRIDEPHKTALLRLVEINGQKTAVSAIRALIRDAAREAGVWEEATSLAQREPQLEVA